ncbi:hypothetical protein CU098_011673 [Rhizopus stolonifer]|uniref:WRKY domain-containing protein n=1 Tax=Rhizopus stolonifer TaxID=4846 RepID=A0A367KI26_RHIST|nr:hypothetical protein CU098_011673 [Rhizopus stolonifer]
MNIKLSDKKRSCLPYNTNDTPPLYDLQEVIQQYQSQPELLKLILTSKVEEDKRRAEEAKLRAKELDLYLQHNNQPPSPTGSPPTTPRLESEEEEEEPIVLEEPKRKRSYKVLPTTSKKARSVPYPSPNPPANYNSSFSSGSSISSLSSEEEDMDQHQQRRHSAAAAMLAMGGSLVEESSAYPSPTTDPVETDEKEDSNKPRRRREMQAITKIVETREFPYVDNYFWKNNGNTVQKKTGCKSIYYKCSNSNKGCSVNKTVTARPNGEYLIKYRGCHLPECGRVERIRDL